MRRGQNRCRRAGFTLVELMVVVTIIAIVSAAVVPSFGITLQRNRMRDAAMLVISAAYTAHGRAARMVTCHKVAITTSPPAVAGGNGGRVVFQAYNVSETSNCSLNVVNDTDPSHWLTLSDRVVSAEIGNDIALAAAFTRASGSWATGGSSQLNLYFDPTGATLAQFGAGAAFPQDVAVSVRGYTGAGTKMGGSRHVRITSGGSARYTDIQGIP